MSDAIQIPGEPSRALVPQPPATLEVAAQRLRPGDRIERFGVIYEYKAKVPGGKKFIRLDTGADDIVVTNMVLLQEMEQRIIKLAAQPGSTTPGRHLTFEARSQTEKRMAWMRLAVDREGWPIGRLWVTAVLDRCTRCVVGQHVHVEPPSSLTVAAALRNAFAPKLYILRRWPEIGRAWPCWGKPTLIILDNALENKVTFLTEALMELGIAWHWAAERKPEEKPYVERYFGTMDSDLATRIPGWTGANTQEKGDYDAFQMSCLTEEDSDEIIHRWVVAYNIDTHTFNGMKVVPEQNWREATDLEVTPIGDLGMLDVLMGDYAVRRARRTGIELLGLRYGDMRAPGMQ